MVTDEIGELFARVRLSDEPPPPAAPAQPPSTAPVVLDPDMWLPPNAFGVPLRKPFALFPYQEQTVARMQLLEAAPRLGMRGGMLRASMGLGKTLMTETLAAASFLAPAAAGPGAFLPEHALPRTTLVVVPLTLLTTWTADMRKFFGEGAGAPFPLLVLHRSDLGGARFDALTPEECGRYAVVLTTYDVVVGAAKKLGLAGGRAGGGARQKRLTAVAAGGGPPVGVAAVLFGVEWGRVVADESQRFANYKTSLFAAMTALRSPVKWCLTGTPVRNDARDLWAQLRFCGLAECESPRTWSAKVYAAMGLSDRVISVSYADARVTLPPKRYQFLELVPTEAEATLYAALAAAGAEAVEDFTRGKVSFTHVLSVLTRMRQASVAPCLAAGPPEVLDGEPAEPEGGAEARGATAALVEARLPEGYVEWLARGRFGEAGIGASKVRACLEVLTRGVPAGEKTIIFSSFTGALRLLQQALAAANLDWGWTQVDGSLDKAEREERVHRFRTSPTCRVLLIHYKVGCEGLNLVEARHVLFVEPWWSPAVQEQAEARAHRIGQTHPVTVWVLFMKHSIEGAVQRKMREKTLLAAELLGGDAVLCGETLQPREVDAAAEQTKIFSREFVLELLEAARGQGDAADPCDSLVQCCICLRALLPAQAQVLACGHSEFHRACLDTWCRKARTCPLCRAEI